MGASALLFNRTYDQAELQGVPRRFGWTEGWSGKDCWRFWYILIYLVTAGNMWQVVIGIALQFGISHERTLSKRSSTTTDGLRIRAGDGLHEHAHRDDNEDASVCLL